MIPFLQKINALIRQYDLLPKLLSILLAVILWANLQNSQIDEISYSIYPDIVNLPKELIIVEDIPKINFTIRGKKEYVKSINISNIKLYIDMSKPVVGKRHEYKVQAKGKETFNKVEYIIDKEKIELSVHKIKYKIVPVEPIIIGQLSDQFKRGIIGVDPDYVKISGADVIVDTIKNIKTDPLNVENEKQTVQVLVHCNTKEFPKISVFPDTVKLSIPIVPVSSLYQLHIPIEIRNKRADANYMMKNKKIILYIKKSNVNIEINETMFTAYINGDINTISNETVNVPVLLEKKIKLPFDIYSYEPTDTDVTITYTEH